MPWVIFFFIFFLSTLAAPTRAIEEITYNSTNGFVTNFYNNTAPTSSNIPNWSTGWPATNVTGWNYVGQVNASGGPGSGVYLGYGWVLTAGHIGIGNFYLGGVTYGAIPGSTQSITNSDGTADLALFQISNAPPLLPLTVSTNAPSAYIPPQAGTPVAMLGMASPQGLSWGYDTITETNQFITPGGYSYTNTDFFTDNGIVKRGAPGTYITNNATVISGDSGGGDFTYNTTTKKWELSGINEVTGSYEDYSGYYYGNGTFSGFVQLSTYAPQIASTAVPPSNDTPTMPVPALIIMACLLLFVASRFRE